MMALMSRICASVLSWVLPEKEVVLASGAVDVSALVRPNQLRPAPGGEVGIRVDAAVALEPLGVDAGVAARPRLITDAEPRRTDRQAARTHVRVSFRRSNTDCEAMGAMSAGECWIALVLTIALLETDRSAPPPF